MATITRARTMSHLASQGEWAVESFRRRRMVLLGQEVRYLGDFPLRFSGRPQDVNLKASALRAVL